jgi:hypothetical protein
MQVSVVLIDFIASVSHLLGLHPGEMLGEETLANCDGNIAGLALSRDRAQGLRS